MVHVKTYLWLTENTLLLLLISQVEFTSLADFPKYFGFTMD